MIIIFGHFLNQILHMFVNGYFISWIYATSIISYTTTPINYITITILNNNMLLNKLMRTSFKSTTSISQPIKYIL